MPMLSCWDLISALQVGCKSRTTILEGQQSELCGSNKFTRTTYGLTQYFWIASKHFTAISFTPLTIHENHLLSKALERHSLTTGLVGLLFQRKNQVACCWSARRYGIGISLKEQKPYINNARHFSSRKCHLVTTSLLYLV